MRRKDADPLRRRPASRNVLLLIALGVLTVVIAASIGATVLLDAVQERSTTANREDRIAIRRLEVALGHQNAATLGYALTSDLDYFAAYLRGTQAVADNAPVVLARHHDIDEATTLTPLLQAWQIATELVRDNRPGDAVTALHTAHARERAAAFESVLRNEFAKTARADARRTSETSALKLLLRSLTLGGLFVGVILAAVVLRRIVAAVSAGDAAREQVEQLFAMGDMLQSAVDMDDTNAVLSATAARLLPGLSGALYVFNNSRDRLDLSVFWGGWPDTHVDHLSQSACWALKRGKPHANGIGPAALRCAHSMDGLRTLDIPMAARGQLHGLLEIAAEGADADARLEHARPIAAAIADAMSLALSNAALRDQLRNQALRDGLTGLYNRRFLEEVRERLCLDAERRGSSIGLIMLDLDRFKHLNDTHGHGAGDTVLREVAELIVACVRGTDIVCRYGGEELLVLLPDCGLEAAASKAEQIRHRIASHGFTGGISVTASFGVAVLPDTSTSARTLLTDADAALYRAKTGGRNQVVHAPAREGVAVLAEAA